jgi:hypothetical protein
MLRIEVKHLNSRRTCTMLEDWPLLPLSTGNTIALQLNIRPRKRHGFKSPTERLCAA